MQYGIELPNVYDARTLAEFASLAEQSGWDGIFLEDYVIHHSAPDASTYDPWIALAAMALRTERIRLGTTVTPLSRRRPWKLARETVTLDHLSNGRLILGVGLGDLNDHAVGQVGEATDTKQRAEMLGEALDVLTGLWSGQPFSYSGKYYHVHNVTMLPRPVQTPRIPIWVGGNWPHKGPFRRAARWDGFVGGKEHGPDEDWRLSPAEIRALIAEITSRRSTAAPFDIALGGAPRSHDVDRDRAYIRSAAEAGATWWMEWVAPANNADVRDYIEQGPLRDEMLNL
ncbi:MAG: LLM class flavin-dependent oxidoreductase [Aggregatilineales bacterium]